MKFSIYSALAVLSFASLGSAWVFSTPKIVKNAASVATASVIIASSVAGANAIDFNGSYADPFHPNCRRIVSVSSGSTATLKGTDGNPGCPTDGSGREWTLTGTIDADGKNIVVDFTPKGGPKDLKGAWDGDGIRWPDGNKWTLKRD
ncbi:hypothetical protein MPSEU_000274500 [Mayamaea pseudoterrestris]|nr:hypothetical protein MPSEU_000274500 [Mayamaea pseudoterrestris]